MSEPTPEPDPTLSRDATHSTYEPAPVDPEQNPPPGPATVQTLGRPVEVTPSKRGAASSSARTKED